jgi:hypothetical protein
MKRAELLKTAKPILFSTEMVQAILSGRKSQTRRVIKFKFRNGKNPDFSGYEIGEYFTGKIETGAVLYSRNGDMQWENATFPNKPRYKTGDILYVRETWAVSRCMTHQFDTKNTVGNECSCSYAYKAKVKLYDDEAAHYDDRLYPSIHMPKEAARIFLRVTNVRAERLHEITYEGARAEGIDVAGASYQPHYRGQFKDLWDGLNAKRGYDWESNPWVWVYEFERVEVEL